MNAFQAVCYVFFFAIYYAFILPKLNNPKAVFCIMKDEIVRLSCRWYVHDNYTRFHKNVNIDMNFGFSILLVVIVQFLIHQSYFLTTRFFVLEK